MLICYDDTEASRLAEAATRNRESMPTINIDGEEMAFEGKKLVLQVAIENGRELPHYCYHPGLSVVASCRICLAQIAQPNPRNDNRVEMLPKLLPTCQTYAVDGMQVHTTSPAAIANQKAVMEYLLINHPLDCPVCDQAGECHLQDYSYRYGRAESRFQEDKIKQPKKDIGPHVYLYSDRCIMCSRCVRFTREVTGTGEIGVFGRGNQEQIDVFPGIPLDNDLSGNVVDLCPVGALLDKDFLFQQRVWFLTKTPSIDGITASGDNIWIEHNAGRVHRVKPRTNLDINRWWITDEVRYGWKFIHSEDRLTTPKRMQFAAPIEIDWPRAYEAAGDGLKKAARESGPGGLAALISPMLASEEAYLLATYIRGLDPEALLAVGPVPKNGEDRTYPGGYTVYAEKCPNRRGVTRALELLGGRVVTCDEFITAVGDKSSPIAGVLVAGGYPSAWATKELTSALKKKFVVAIDTLPNDLTAAADVLLPAVTWAEKSGCFENAKGILQSFDQAIAPLENTRPDGQIALDLLAESALEAPSRYNAGLIRSRMGGSFAGQVQRPAPSQRQEPQMQYVEL